MTSSPLEYLDPPPPSEHGYRKPLVNLVRITIWWWWCFLQQITRQFFYTILFRHWCYGQYFFKTFFFLNHCKRWFIHFCWRGLLLNSTCFSLGNFEIESSRETPSLLPRDLFRRIFLCSALLMMHADMFNCFPIYVCLFPPSISLPYF